jgi:hypothetical protein
VKLAWTTLALVLSSAPMFAQDALHRIPEKSRYSLDSFKGKRPLTRAERTNFAETSRYDDVVLFIDSLKTLGAKIVTGSIGKTNQGRELPYVIASRPLISTPGAIARWRTYRPTSTPARSKEKRRCKRCFAISSSTSGQTCSTRSC